MDRRNFAKSLGVKAGALSALAAAPVGFMATPLRALAKTSDPGLLPLCKAILKQNLLQPDERMLVATGYMYDEEYVMALLQAGAELGAAVMHLPVFPKWEGEKMVSGRTATHAKIYAEADLLLDVSMGRPPGVPSPGVGSGKFLDHEFKSDRQFMTRPGSRTRWLSIGGMSSTVGIQRYLFPTKEIRARSIRGAEIFHNGKELRVRCPHGTDLVCSLEGRTGHSQYGIADVGGRWDNFATAVVAAAAVETSTEGVIVYVAGDDIKDIEPRVLPNDKEKITLTYGSAGQITKVDGGRLAKEFEEYLASYNHPDITRLAHIGYGTDHRIHRLNHRVLFSDITSDMKHQFHHNAWGSVMIAMGRNNQYHGGPHANYSGLGLAARNAAPSHPHTALIQGASLWVDDVLLCDNGELTKEATGGV